MQVKPGVGIGAVFMLGWALSTVRVQTAQAPSPSLRFIPGSTSKVEQLLGETDLERHQPTLSRTVTRYGLEGTDLGYSFEHQGRVYFLFGDTVGSVGRALDSIGITDARDPEAGVRLDFLTASTSSVAGGRRGNAARGGRAGRATPPAGQSQYLTIQPDGISMGPFEVPSSGISLNNQMFIVVTTNHNDERTSDKSVLVKFTPPEKFSPGRTISQLPEGRFIKMSLHEPTTVVDGLPPGGPFIYMWGTGKYRASDLYFALVPASQFENGRGTRYLAGFSYEGAPIWKDREADAVPVVRNGTMGDVSVTWCEPLKLWLMTYDSRPPGRQGILFSYSRTPWGPWSSPELIFSSADGLGKFIHNSRGNPPDNLVGPVIGRGQSDPSGTHGGAYAPYVVERWTKVQNNQLTIYYTLSTWNPYVVVLIRSQFSVLPGVP